MFVGIDSHKDSLAVCVVDGSGREVRSAVLENSAAGHRDLLAWAQRTGTLERFGIEGSANLGAGLARALMAEGETVCEVPCEMTVRASPAPSSGQVRPGGRPSDRPGDGSGGRPSSGPPVRGG